MTQNASEPIAQELDPGLLKAVLWFAELSLKERIAVAWAVANGFQAKGELDLAGSWAKWAMEMERELIEGIGEDRSGNQQHATEPNRDQGED